jgi:hypothetical protein
VIPKRKKEKYLKVKVNHIIHCSMLVLSIRGNTILESILFLLTKPPVAIRAQFVRERVWYVPMDLYHRPTATDAMDSVLPAGHHRPGRMTDVGRGYERGRCSSVGASKRAAMGGRQHPGVVSGETMMLPCHASADHPVVNFPCTP